MNRKHILGWCAVLLIVGVWTAMVQSQTSAFQVHVHFFVAPSLLPDGSSSEKEIAALKQFLVETTGGYSEIGEAEGGWMNAQGQRESEMNHSFMVSSTEDRSVEIRDFLAEHFSENFPYVLTWTASQAEGVPAAVPLWFPEKH